MDYNSFKLLINNKTVSDEDVFKALLLYTEDVFDEAGDIIPVTDEEVAEISEIRSLMDILRPDVVELMRKHVLMQHANCPSCKELFHDEMEHEKPD